MFNAHARDLVRSSALIVGMGMLGNMANYFYQFGMGRLLDLSDFGALNAILALNVILSVPAATITLVKAKYIARLIRNEQWQQIRTLYFDLLKRVTLFGGGAVITVVLFRSLIQDFLKLHHSWPVILFGALIFFSLLMALNVGFFQGLERFGFYVGLGFSNALLRLLCGLVLVWMGAALAGAISAAVLAPAVVFFVSLLFIFRLLGPYQKQEGDEPIPLRLFSTSATLFFLTAITFMDMVFVKHLFHPEQAGVYAGVAVLGRTALYLPGAVTQVLLPKASKANSEESSQLFTSSTLLTVGISSVCVILFYLYPESLLRLLLGGKYQGGAGLLAPYGLAMLSYAVMGLFINFCLARDIQDIYKVLTVVFLLQVAVLYFVATDIQDIPLYLTLTGLAACLALLIKIRNGTRPSALA